MPDDLALERFYSSEKSDGSKAQTSEPQHQTNLLSAFGESFKTAALTPVIGARQLCGDQKAADQYFRTLNENQYQGVNKWAGMAGGLAGNALTFIGTAALARSLPGVGRTGAVIAGGALGFLNPLQKDEAPINRLAHAGVGAATVAILEFGPGAIKDFGFSSRFREDMMKVGLSGFAAGVVNSEAQSLLMTGQFAKPSEAAMSGLTWGLTGAGFHAVGTGFSKLSPFGIGKPPEGEVYLVGSRHSEEGFITRDFLAKNHIPYKVIEPEHNFFARRMLSKLTGGAPEGHTVMILPDGRKFLCPKPFQMATELGMPVTPRQGAYDTVIIGAGPAGLQASIYGTSEGLRTLLIDGRGPGGQAGTTSRVENVMGFENGISGPELMGKAFQQTRRLGTEFILNEVRGLGLHPDGSLMVSLRDGSQVRARSVVLATGVQFREMANVPGLKDLHGRGVYYGAAMTEAPLTKAGERVVIVGGANSAGQAAVKMSEMVGPKGQVVMLARSPLEKSMSDYLVDQIRARPNIRVEIGAEVQSVTGSKSLESVTYANKTTGATSTKPADSMFVFIGSAPQTHWLSGKLAVDEQGFLRTGLAARDSRWTLPRDPLPNETSIPGVFTAGDVHAGTAKRIITAAGEGANTVSQIHQWLGSEYAPRPLQSPAPHAIPVARGVTADVPAIWPQMQPASVSLLRNAANWANHERMGMRFRLEPSASAR